MLMFTYICFQGALNVLTVEQRIQVLVVNGCLAILSVDRAPVTYHAQFATRPTWMMSLSSNACIVHGIDFDSNIVLFIQFINWI